MPNTGVTLPFISYGGTSIVFLMSEMAIALSVAPSDKNFKSKIVLKIKNIFALEPFFWENPLDNCFADYILGSKRGNRFDL